MTNSAIHVSNLTKIYAQDLKAVDSLSLDVKEGEIMALLGPNGAGKSTTLRVLSTLSGFDEGEVTVDGIDIDRDPEAVRRTIGVVAQQTGVEYFMTGRENMMIQGRLYKMKKADILQRIDELAKYFELEKSIDRLVTTYSGGMRRKLDIATALIHRPKILYLDEPTLGLDIHSRKLLWKYIEELNQKHGLTILLTTHYLEEADGLAHRVAIINEGKIQIIGTPEELKNSIHGDSVVISFDTAGDKEKAYADGLKASGQVMGTLWDGDNLHLYVDDGASSVPAIMEQAAKDHVQVKALSLARPTLDDVFLKYTGTSMLDTGEEETEEWWHQWAGKDGGKGGSWGGNKWVNSDGSQNGEWDESDDWKGNDWVEADGTAKPAAASDETPASETPANDTQIDSTQTDDAQADNTRTNDTQNSAAKDNDVNDNTETNNQTPNSGDQTEGAETSTEQKWPDGEDGSADWKGNEWVNADGKPKGNLDK